MHSTAPKIYAELLLPKGHGYPMWCPAPNEVLPQHYQNNGVDVGDVGLITEEGAFDFLFNVFLPPDHIINQARGVPEDFQPLEKQPNQLHVDSRYHSARSPISSKGTKSYVLDLEGSMPIPGPPGVTVGGGIELKFSRSSGAVLMLSKGAGRTNYMDRRTLAEYAVNNAESWYQYVNGPLGRQACSGDLYLVTGVDKASDWEVAAFSNPSQEQKISLKFTSGGIVDGKLRMERSSDLEGDFSYREADEVRIAGRTNQAVFIRGFKIRCKTRTIGPKSWTKVKVQDVTGSTSSQVLYRGEVVSSPVQYQTSAPAVGGYDQRRSRQNTEVAEVAETQYFSDSSDSSSSSSELYQPMRNHPADIINEYMLNMCQDVDVAITHDEDWCSILNEADNEIPDDSELLARIEEKHNVYVGVSSGVTFVTLQPKNSNGNPSLYRGTNLLETTISFSATASTPDSGPPTVIQPSKRRPRREEPAITPAQPSSAQTKRQANVHVVVACQQCRSRKIRCDGAKPACSNCNRRGNDCNYDPATQRRSQDRIVPPGQRMARELKRRKMEVENQIRWRREPSPPFLAQLNQFNQITQSENGELPLNGSLSPASFTDYNLTSSSDIALEAAQPRSSIITTTPPFKEQNLPLTSLSASRIDYGPGPDFPSPVEEDSPASSAALHVPTYMTKKRPWDSDAHNTSPESVAYRDYVFQSFAHDEETPISKFGEEQGNGRRAKKGKAVDKSDQNELDYPILVSSDSDSSNDHSRRPTPLYTNGSHSGSSKSDPFIHHFPKRYFVVKAPSQGALDLSVQKNLWATQKHIEEILDEAYQTSSEIFLIFAASNSGEFYGYAKMASAIQQGESSIPWATRKEFLHSLIAPMTDLEPATETIGDGLKAKAGSANSAGYLSGDWLNKHLSGIKLQSGDELEGQEDYTMSKPFKVKWICTERLPFNRVNHLRNAWNDDRPVRVSNDGMELEPAVGALLLKEWVKERKRRLQNEMDAKYSGW